MKVLFLARTTLYSVSGGDTIQIESTAKYLRKLNVTVDIRLSNEKIDYSAYDLFHFFNVIDPEDILGHAIKCGKPYVVSTIYVDYSEYDKHHRKDIIGVLSKFFSYNSVEYFKTLGKFLFKNEQVSSPYFFIKGHRNSIKYILRNAACLLPNSNNEYLRLTRDFGIASKHIVVPNAVDTTIFNNTLIKDNRDDNLILCVGRIEGNKNQLRLIEAVANTNFRLVLIGRESTNQKQYVNECKQAANSNVTFISHLEQAELLKYYLKAKVHVLPSWFETTGLSNLEAGVLGCNIVAADRGDVREYFDGFVEFCEPDNIESIRNAIMRANKKPINAKLREHIIKNYTWEIAAQKTLQAYQWVLKNNI